MILLGIGPGLEEVDYSKTLNTIVKVNRGQYTYNNELTTTIEYLNDATLSPYPMKGDKWSFTKQVFKF